MRWAEGYWGTEWNGRNAEFRVDAVTSDGIWAVVGAWEWTAEVKWRKRSLGVRRLRN